VTNGGLAHDQTGKRPQPDSARNLIESLRESLRDDRAALEQYLYSTAKLRSAQRASRLIDQYLRVSGGLALPGTIALVAVGVMGVASYIKIRHRSALICWTRNPI